MTCTNPNPHEPESVQYRAHEWLEERRGTFTISEFKGVDGSENHVLGGTWDDVVSWFLSQAAFTRKEPVS